MKINNVNKKIFAKYIRETYKNKLVAILLIAIGVFIMLLTNGDATILTFTSIIGIPLFFSKKNYIY